MDSRKVIDEINSLDEDSNSVIKSSRKGLNLGTIILIIAVFILILGFYLYSTKDKRLAKEALIGFGEYLSENKDQFYNSDIDDDWLYSENVEYEELDEYTEKAFEEEAKNIAISKEFNDINGNLGIVINNQNAEATTGILIQVIFYNQENKPIKIAENAISILEPNIDYYVTFTNTPEEYNRYEFLITKEYADLKIKSLKSSVTYEVKDKDEYEIVITGKNSSSEDIDELEFFLIYYDENNNILGVDTIYEYDIDKNSNFKLEEFKILNEDESYDEVEYLRYELVLGSAYTYDY